jgi:organic hydroperoxide reductase OsmC/OhrA
MPAPFPHRYEVALAWDRDGGGRLTSPQRAPIVCGAPPEFDGEPGWWSPEHLLLSALATCFATTLTAIARKARVSLSLSGLRAEATLDKTSGGLAFTSIVLHADVQAPPADVERALELAQSAKRHCIVANSLKPPVELRASVVEWAAA